jgi:hypothetical protein
MIERFWQQLKHGWLFLHTLDSLAELERLTRWYAEQHNAVMPHFAFDGQTPDEMYFETGVAVPAALAEAHAGARTERIEVNRKLQFNAPPAARLPTSRRPRRIPWKSRSAALAYGGLQDVRSRGTGTCRTTTVAVAVHEAGLASRATVAVAVHTFTFAEWVQRGQLDRHMFHSPDNKGPWICRPAMRGIAHQALRGNTSHFRYTSRAYYNPGYSGSCRLW